MDDLLVKKFAKQVYYGFYYYLSFYYSFGYLFCKKLILSKYNEFDTNTCIA